MGQKGMGDGLDDGDWASVTNFLFYNDVSPIIIIVVTLQIAPVLFY